VQGITVTAVADGTLEVAFALPGGAYATAMMREVMKSPEITVPQPVDDAPEAT
jgi:tRNA(Glu) U13 pseudouridine synthase TruD